jgi:hypothetical protein
MPIGKSLAKLPKGAGEPGEVTIMRDAINKQTPSGTQRERRELRRDALIRLLAEDPKGAAEYLADYGISPEEFVAAILELDESEGLNFDVDEQELATALDNISIPESPANKLAQVLSPQVEEPPAPGTPPVPLIQRESRVKDDRVGAALKVSPPSVEEPPAPGIPPIPIIQRGSEQEQEAPTQTPTADRPGQEEQWLIWENERRRQQGLPPIQPGEGVSPTDTGPRQPHQTGGDTVISPDGVYELPPSESTPESGPGRAPTPPAPLDQSETSAPTSAASPSSGIGAALSLASASPQNAGTAEQSQLLRVLNDALMGVGQVGNPEFPEVATPPPPPGAGSVPQSDLAQKAIQARLQQQIQQKLSLGRALAL